MKLISINKTGKMTILLGLVFLIVNILPLESSVMPETEVSASLINENILIYGVTSNPASFDPLGAYDSASRNIILNMLEGLFTYDYSSNDMQIIPRLAANMGTWDESSKEFTIPLRNDVTWWDGTSFTATDAVWNLNRANNLASAQIADSSSLWMDENADLIIESVEERGTYEIKITLSALGLSDILNLLATPWASFIKPDDDFSDSTMNLDDSYDLIGTGPFMFSSYFAGEETTLTAYTGYYRGMARIPEIVFQFFADFTDCTDALLAHEIHVVRSIQDNEYETAITDPDIFVELLKSDCVYFYHMNVNNIPWAVRKAFQFAFNYSYVPTLSATLLAHQHPIPEGIEGYNPELSGLPYYDLAKARDYMLNSEDAGIQAAIIRNGITASSSDEEWITVAQSDDPLYAANFTHYGTSFYTFLANYAQDVGVDLINDQVGDWSTFLAWTNVPENKASMQFSMGGWCPDFPNAESMLTPLYTTDGESNWNGLANSTIDANIAAISALSGSDKLDMIDTVVTQIVVEQAATMYTISSASLIAWNTNALTGITEGGECLLNPMEDKYFYPITIGPFVDSDEDGLSDESEVNLHETDPNDADSDDDGLEDGEEVNLHDTDPNAADSDEDGLTDFEEIDEYQTDPNLNDTDDDGLTDFQEIDEYQTDPNLTDTDGDGFDDKEEIDANSDPLDKDDIPSDSPFDKLLDLIPGFPVISLFIASFLPIGLLFYRKRQNSST